MKIQAAAIQMPCDILDLPTNLQRADELIRTARDAGSELVVLPELFNTGYSLCPDFGPCSETAEGPTLSYLRQRSRRWKMAIAAGFVERAGGISTTPWPSARPMVRSRSIASATWFSGNDSRFHPGRAPLVVSTPFGRVGLAVCADMIYRRVWDDYRGRIDLAVVAAAWPDFANRDTGRRHWLLGHVGPLSTAIPAKVAARSGNPGDLRQPMWRDPDHHPGPPHDDLGPVRRPEQHLRWPPRCPRPRRPRTLGSGRPHHPPFEARFEIVEFYVPLGLRGFLLRLGTFVIGIFGGVVYRQAARRRELIPSNPSLSVALAEILATE